MAGFTFAYRLNGGMPTIQDLLFADTETLSEGDMLNLASGEVDLGATGDTNFLGVALETVSGTDSTTRIQCIVDADVVYSVEDSSARLKGATLDLAGATNAQTIAASSNKNFVVHTESTATQPTLVRFNVGMHHENTAL